MVICFVLFLSIGLHAANQAKIPKAVKIEFTADERTKYAELLKALLQYKDIKIGSLDPIPDILNLVQTIKSPNVFNFQRSADNKVLLEIANDLNCDLFILAAIADHTDLTLVKSETVINKAKKGKNKILVFNFITNDLNQEESLKLFNDVGFIDFIVLSEVICRSPDVLENLTNNLTKESKSAFRKQILHLIFSMSHLKNHLQNFDDVEVAKDIENLKICCEALHAMPEMEPYTAYLKLPFFLEQFWIELQGNFVGYLVSELKNPSKGLAMFDRFFDCLKSFKNVDFDFNKFCVKNGNILMQLYRVFQDNHELLMKFWNKLFEEKYVDINYIFQDNGEDYANVGSSTILSFIISQRYVDNQDLILYLLSKNADLNIQLLVRELGVSSYGKFFVYNMQSPFEFILYRKSSEFLEKVIEQYQSPYFDYNQSKIKTLNNITYYSSFLNSYLLNSTEIHPTTLEDRCQKILILKNHGADINNYRSNCTSLMLAIGELGTEMVKFLLQHGADMDKKMDGINAKMYLDEKIEKLQKATPLNWNNICKEEHHWKKFSIPEVQFRIEEIKRIIQLSKENIDLQKELYIDQQIARENITKEEEKVAKSLAKESMQMTKRVINDAAKFIKTEEEALRTQFKNEQEQEFKDIQESYKSKNAIPYFVLNEQKVQENLKQEEQSEFNAIATKENQAIKRMKNLAKLQPLAKAAALENQEPSPESRKKIIEPKVLNADELLFQKNYQDMSVDEKNKVDVLLERINENIWNSIPLNLRATYGYRESFMNKKNVIIDLDHIFSFKVSMKENQVNFDGGHLYDSCNRLRALSIVDIEKTKEIVMSSGCIQFTFYPKALNAVLVTKTTFPRDWTIEKICEEIVNAKFIRAETSALPLEVVYAQSATNPNIFMKMIFKSATPHFPTKLITVIPMDSMNDSVALPASPKQAKMMKSVVQAVPVERPKGAKWVTTFDAQDLQVGGQTQSKKESLQKGK
jgi:hypothetical protein